MIPLTRNKNIFIIVKLYQKVPDMSKFESLKYGCLKFLSILLTNLFWVPSFYRYMATKQNSRQVLILLALVLFYSVITLPVAGVLTLVTIISIALVTSPFIIFSSLIDPFIGWIRGDFDKPWGIIKKAMTAHLWAAVSPIFPLLLLMMISMATGLMDLDDPETSQSGPGIVFLLYGLLVGVHLFFALKGNPDMRTQQKVISGLMFVMMFWAVPIAHFTNYMINAA